jgi:hypothetical protein
MSLRNGCALVILALAVPWTSSTPRAGETSQAPLVRQLPTSAKLLKIPVFKTGGSTLHFDEADPLSGKRSEVQDTHDRYPGTGPTPTVWRRPTPMPIAKIESLLGRKVGPTNFNLNTNHMNEGEKGNLVLDRCYVDGYGHYVGFWAPQAEANKPMITINLKLPPGEYLLTCYFSGGFPVAVQGWPRGQTHTFPNSDEPAMFVLDSKGGGVTSTFWITCNATDQPNYLWNEVFWLCEVRSLQ